MVNFNFENFFANLSFFLLLLSMILYWIKTGFMIQIKNFKFEKFGIILSNISLFSFLILRWKESGHFPLSNLYESLMFLSWSITIIHIILEQMSNVESNAFLSNQKGLQRAEGNAVVDSPFNTKAPSAIADIGIITAPCALFTNAFATLSLPSNIREASPLVPALQSNWLMMHVTVMILSYAALITGSLLSIAFLILTQSQSITFPIITKEEKESSSQKTDNVESNAFLSNQKGLQLTEGDVDRKLSINSNEKNVDSFFSNLSKKSAVADAFFSKNSKEDRLLQAEDISVVDSPLNSKGALTLSNPTIDNNVFCKQKTVESFAFDMPTFLSNIEDFRPLSALLKPKTYENRENVELIKLATTLDNLSYRILGIGFPFLTIGILSGAVWANEAWGSYWSWDPKETWALLTWFVFAIYLHSRLTQGWKGKKPAILATVGFFTVWICFLGVNLLGEGLHSYGWLHQS